LTNLGVSGLLTGLATAAYGSAIMPSIDYAYGETVTPNAWIIAGGAAMVISLATMIIGLHGEGKLDQVASAAASARNN
jgi:hypothetical protein